MVMSEAITVEQVRKLLADRVGYRHEDKDDCNRWMEDWTRVDLRHSSGNVRISRDYGYSGEENFSDEEFRGYWNAIVPVGVLEKALAQLAAEGHATLPNTPVAESYRGKPANGSIQDETSLTYTTTLDMTLRKEGDKLVVKVTNPRANKGW